MLVYGESPSLVGSFKSLRKHPRLQRHLRKFQRHRKRAAVIKRYVGALSSSDEVTLRRHACHVGAWVALLPEAEATCGEGSPGLSPVSLLARHLRLLGEVELGPWLSSVVALTKARLEKLKKRSDTLSEHWVELEQTLPQKDRHEVKRPIASSIAAEKKITRTVVVPQQVEDETEQKSASATPQMESAVGQYSNSKSSLLLLRAELRWRNELSIQSRGEYIEGLQHKLELAIAANDQRALRSVLRAAAAALAGPRARGQIMAQSEQSLNDSALDALHISSQKKLRRLALDCMSWLDLADARCFPALSRISGLISKYERDNGVDASTASAGRQWRLLKEALLRTSIGDSAGHFAAELSQGVRRDITPRSSDVVPGGLERVPGEERREIAAPTRFDGDGHLALDAANQNGVTTRSRQAVLNAKDASLHPSKRRRCDHGLHPTICKICNACPHGKLSWHCAECAGCEHGRVKRDCAKCNGCPHGKLKQNCVQCRGCTHGKLLHNCVECRGCPHGKRPYTCVICDGCEHGQVKMRCPQCRGCPHGRVKGNCVQCNGCPHGRLKKNCCQCCGCPHGKVRAKCLRCRGCPHGRMKSKCSVCSSVDT
eukprot:TRINITY_DN16320_c0_g1_i1.p1 TRINITY_DN16320_c0_g1~~TRINITY_DN16320_c0_g1_i1.p1  ORF type:complete len:600 (-),score=49.76 TRINITY_DN16320_c0_g1_i1:7-1806(-)